MPEHVLKESPDLDSYIVWSTVVEYWLIQGTRVEVEDWLREQPECSDRPGATPEDRLSRADELGTSALWPSAARPWGGWEYDGFMVEQLGVLPRAQLGRFVELAHAGDRAAADALLEPIETWGRRG